MRRLACIALAALALAGPARAEQGDPVAGTLKAISDRGSILMGYRDAAPPFSFLNPAGQPVGFSLDICRRIAADIAARLNRDLLEPDAAAWQQGIRLKLVPVAADARLAMLGDGRIDLECGSTTANAERARVVAFSPVFFLAGTRLLVAADSAVQSYRDLAGRRVVVGVGTTNAAVMRRLLAELSPPAALEEAAGLDAAYDALAAGRADALASDDTLLAGLVATKGGRGRFRLVGDYLSYEPYAIGLRRGDADFAALVRDSFARMAGQGMLKAAYDRWFMRRLPNGETMNMPMSPHLAEMFRVLGEPD